MTTRVALLRGTQVVIDLAALSFAVWLAYFMRFDWQVPGQMFRSLLFLWPYVIGLQYAVLFGFGIPRYVWRYVGLREVSRILIATSAATSVLLALRTAAEIAYPD